MFNKVVKFINLVHWLVIIYVSVGRKVYARSGKTLRSRRKFAFLTLEYIPEKEPATKDFTTGLLTNTSILNYFWFDVILFGYFFVFFLFFKIFFFFSRVSYFSHTVLRALFTFCCIVFCLSIYVEFQFQSVKSV